MQKLKHSVQSNLSLHNKQFIIMSCVKMYHGISFNSMAELEEYMKNNYQNVSTILKEYPEFAKETVKYVYDLELVDDVFYNDVNILEKFSQYLDSANEMSLETYQDWLTNSDINDANSNTEFQSDAYDVAELDTNTAAAFSRIIGIVGENFNFQDAATVANNLIKQGHYVSGYFLNNVIALNSNGFKKGTEYHEAFHAVYRTLLSETERARLLELAKNEFGAPTKQDLAAFKQKSNMFNNLTNDELVEYYYEEKLADEFAKYAFENKPSKSWLESIFDKIIDLINSMFGNRAMLESEFDKILRGAYAQRNPKFDTYRTPAFSTLYKPGNTLATNKISNIIFSRIQTVLIQNRENVDIENLNIDDIRKATGVAKAVYFNHSKFEELLEDYNRPYTEDIEARVDSMRDILDNPTNYPIILEEMRKRLSRDISLETEDDTVEQEVGSKTGLMAGSSVTKGGYMNSPSQIRNFLESLTKYEDFLELGLGRDEVEGLNLFAVKINARLVYDSLLRRVSGLPKSRILSAIKQSSLKDPDTKVFLDSLLEQVMKEYYTTKGITPVFVNGKSYKDEFDPRIHTYKALAPYSSTLEGFISTMHVVNSQPTDILIQPSKGAKSEITVVSRADTDNIESQIRNSWESLSKTKTFNQDTAYNELSKIRDIFNDYAKGTVGSNITKNFTRPSDAQTYFKTDAVNIQNTFERIGIELPIELIEYSLIQTYLSKGEYTNFDSIDSIIGNSSGDIITEKDLTKEFYLSVPAQTRPIRLDDLVEISKLLKGKKVSLFASVKDETNPDVKDEELDFQYRINNWAKSSSVFDSKYFNTTYKKSDGKTAYPIIKSNYLFDLNNFYAELGNTNFMKLLETDIDSAQELFSNLLEEYDITSDPWVKKEMFFAVTNSPRFKNGGFKDYIQDMKLYLSNTMKITKFNQDTQESYAKAEKGMDYGDLSGTDKVLQEAYLFANELSKQGSKKRVTYLKSLGENAEKSTNFLSRVEFYNYVDSSGKYSARVFEDFNSILKSELSLIQRLVEERKAFANNFVVGEMVKLEANTRAYFGYNQVHYVTDFSKADTDIDESYYYYPTSSTTVTKVTIQTSTDIVKNVEEVDRSTLGKMFNKFRGETPLFMKSTLDHLTLTNPDGTPSTIKQSFEEGIKEIIDGTRSIEDEFFTKEDWSTILDAKAEFDIDTFIKSNALYIRVNDKGASVVNNSFPSYFNSSTQDYSGEGLLKKTTSKFVLDNGKFKNFLINYTIANFNTDSMHDMNAGLQVSNAVDKFKRNPSQIADGNGMGSGETKVSVVESKTKLYDEVSQNRTGLKIDLSKSKIDVTDAEVFCTSEWIYKTFLHSLGRKSTKVKEVWAKMFAGKAVNQEEFNILSKEGATMLKLKLVSRQVDGYFKMGNAVLDPTEFSTTKGNSVEEVAANQAILDDLAKVYINILDNSDYFNTNESYPVDLANYPALSESTLAKEFYNLSEIRLMMHSLRVPKLGNETLFNTFESMITTNSDWLVFNSATKTLQKDIVPIKNDGKSFLKPFSIKNALIRQQVEMKGSVQSATVTDPTQKMEIIGSEQLDSAIAYFSGTPISPQYLATAYAKQLRNRVLLGMKEVQNALLYDNGEINMKNLVKTFKDTISATNPDPAIEQFFQSLDGETFDLNPNNYGPTFYKAASIFLAYISKNTTTHKTPGAKFTLRTDWGTNIAKLYKYNVSDTFTKEEVKQLEALYNNINEDGTSFGTLNDQQQALVNKMISEYGGRTLEESFTNMISQKKETIYLTEDEYYSPEVDAYGRSFNDSNRLANLENTYEYNPEVDEIVLERLQHRVKDADGNFYSEVVVSEWVANIFGLKIGDEIPPHLLKFFGVRIPTQDKHSMSSYKIVKLLPAQFGNVLITPYEMIYLAGQDLDIDAVYAKMFANNFSAGKNITYGDYLRSETPVDDAFAEQLSYLYYNNKRYKETVENAKAQNAELRAINLDSAIDAVNKSIKKLDSEENPDLVALNETFKSLPFAVKGLFLRERAANKVSKKSKAEQLFSDYGLLQEVSEEQILRAFSDDYKKDEVRRLKDIISGKVKGNQQEASNRLIRIQDQILAKETEILESLDRMRDISERIIGTIKPQDQTVEMFSMNITNKIRRKSEIISEIESAELYSFLNLPAPKPEGIISLEQIKSKFEDVYAEKIENNAAAFQEGRVLDITPLNRFEAANLQLQLEIALQHNTGTKEIAGTPATTDVIDQAFENIVKPSELTDFSDSHSGYTSPADKVIHASNIAEGADGIGIAASYHSTIQKAITNGLEIKDDLEIFGKNKFVFVSDVGTRTNDSNSSVISMFVDNPKLALAYKVRMNLTTAPIGMTLLSLGIPFEQVVGILNQPVVQRIAQIVNQNAGVLKLNDRKVYAWSKQLAEIILSSMTEEGFSGVKLPYASTLAEGIQNEDMLSPNNQVAFTLLYNAAIANRKHWGSKEAMYENIKRTLEQSGKIDLFKNVVINGRQEFNFDTLENFDNLLAAYTSFQEGVIGNLLKAAKVNSSMIKLTQLNGIKKGVTGSFDSVEDIEAALEDLGYTYSLDKKNSNGKVEISDVINIYPDPNLPSVFDNLEVMFNPDTNPLLVENIKSTLYSDRMIASQIFLTRTPFGKRVLRTLFDTGSPYAMGSSESRRKIESSLLSAMMMIRVKKKMSQMKKAGMQNVFLDSFNMTESALRDELEFNFEDLFTDNTKVLNEVIGYLAQNKGRFKFMSKLKTTQVPFKQLGNQVLHKLETQTFTDLAPEDVSQLQDEFKLLMEDPVAKSLVQSIIRHSFLVQNGRFKKSSVIKTLDVEVVKEVMSSLDDVLDMLSFKPGSNSEFTADDFVSKFGISMGELIQTIQVGIFSNPDFNFEVRTVNNTTFNIQKNMMEKKSTDEDQKEFEIQNKEELTTDAYDATKESNVEDDEKQYTSVFNIKTPISLVGDSKAPESNKLVINLFGGFDGKNFRQILDTLKATNIVKLKTRVVPAPTAENPNATKKIVSLIFPTIVKIKGEKETRLFRLRTVKTDKESTYKDKEGEKKTKRLVVSAVVANSIYDVPSWYRKMLGSKTDESIINSWNDRLMKQFMTYKEDGAIMFEGTAAVYEPYHLNGNKEIGNFGFTLGQMDTMFIPELNKEQTEQTGKFIPVSKSTETKVKKIIQEMKKLKNDNRSVNSIYDEIVDPEKRLDGFKHLSANEYMNTLLKYFKC